jgi:hypothetical protein
MTSAATAVLSRTVSRLRPAALEDAQSAVGLQTRVDRKYIVPADQLERLIRDFGGRLAALDVDGRRLFGYESTYFDTSNYISYLGAAHRRRRRFKVRTRTYLDSGQCMLEVKVRSGRGETVKHRLPYSPEDRARITPAARAFIAGHVGELDSATALVPSLTIRYLRATLIDLADGARITVDADLHCARPDGSQLVLEDRLIVETKSAGPPARADRALWAAGHRPVSISKYGVGMAGLDPTLPGNTWHRVLSRYFCGQPAGPRAGRTVAASAR